MLAPDPFQTDDGSAPGPALAAMVDRLRPPNMAEMVSSALRAKILARELADGDVLPKQEELALQFGTSALSVREGLRILEGEGLVTVRRGRHGGAIVHSPSTGSAAYMLGLVFQSKDVRLREVAATLNDLEPICAGLCAEREDRHSTVLPQLRALQEAARNEQDVGRQVILGRRFHEQLVRSCGRDTMVVLIGVLESIWTAHSQQSVLRGTLTHGSLGDDYLSSRHADHDELIALIDDGNVEAAAAQARRHLESSTLYRMGSEGGRLIEADLLSHYIPAT